MAEPDLFSLPKPTTPEKRVKELRAELERHNRLYYNNAQPEISDAEYDKLFRELETLEAKYPEFHDPDSPTLRVGGEAISSFQQIQHTVPMLSIDDVFELKDSEIPQAELIAFYQRLRKNLGREEVAVTIEPKIDGVAVSLRYENGKLAYAATRGDGTTGDDITHNVRTIRNVPLELKLSPTNHEKDETTGNPLRVSSRSPQESLREKREIELAGSHGSDVQKQIQQETESIPTVLEIRGEIFMPNLAFAAMNAERDEAGLPTFANPRNATAGTLKQLDPKIAAKRPLKFIAHGLGAYDGPPLATEYDFRNLLESVGIPPNKPSITAENLTELLAAVAEIDQIRHDFDYGTDGAVVKVLDRSEREKLGTTSRAPRWAAAYKFLPEQAETTIRDIRIQVGRTGVLTPVAELDPVFISGSTVARATLHNQDEIDRKDIRIASRVIIEKAGEIIPAVVSVISHPPHSKTYNIFAAVDGKCPSCQGPISQEEGFVAWRCTNFECPAQAVTRISHFASRKALDLDGLGETVAEALVRHGHCKTALDLFSLTEDVLGPLNLGTEESPRRFGEKNAAKVLTALQAAKHKPLNRWLYAMGIRQLGESAAKELSRLHERLTEIPDSPILRELLKDPRPTAKKQNAFLAQYAISGDVGPAVAESVTAFFDSETGKHVLERLLSLGIDPVSDNYLPKLDEADLSQLPLAGKTFVITGTLSKDRDEFKTLIESKGGKVTGSVSAKTSYVLAGEGGGSKRDKAEKLGVPLLTEDEFQQLLAN